MEGLSEEKRHIQSMIRDAIVMLCKSGLTYNLEVSIEGLLGVTLDKKDIFLVNIKELIQPVLCASDSNVGSMKESLGNPYNGTDTQEVRESSSVKIETSDEQCGLYSSSLPSGTPTNILTSPDTDCSSSSISTVQEQIIASSQQTMSYTDNQSTMVSEAGVLEDNVAAVKKEPVGIAVPSGGSTDANAFMQWENSSWIMNKSYSLNSNSQSEQPNDQYAQISCRKAQMKSSSASLKKRLKVQSSTVSSQGKPAVKNVVENVGNIQMVSSQTYVCPLCSKVFTCKQSCIEHEQAHRGIFRYRCALCGKGFRHTYVYETHMNKHRGILHAYMCNLCDKKFTRLDTLKTHYKMVHGQVYKHKIAPKQKQHKMHDITPT